MGDTEESESKKITIEVQAMAGDKQYAHYAVKPKVMVKIGNLTPEQAHTIETMWQKTFDKDFKDQPAKEMAAELESHIKEFGAQHLKKQGDAIIVHFSKLDAARHFANTSADLLGLEVKGALALQFEEASRTLALQEKAA